MRAISHVGTTPAPVANNGSSRSAHGNTPHRRVMRAAWTIHRTSGGAFSDALRQAWQHEKARSGLSAAKTLQGEIMNSAYLSASISEIRSAFPIEDYHRCLLASRSFIVGLIERLISVLDVIDGDADFEDDSGDMEPDERRLAKALTPELETVQIARY